MLSEKIYTLRRKSGLSQEQLAEKIGVSRQAISKWEGGLSTPELDKLRSLSNLFNVSIDELTSEQMTDSYGITDLPEQKASAANQKNVHTRIGVFLCLIGAVCLILFGVLTIILPFSIEELNESSVITVNGTGILMLLFLLFMVAGIILILKKK